jgi:hypothetical protein
MAMQNRFGNIGQVTPKKLAVLAALAASGRSPVVKPEHYREICAVDVADLARDVRRIGEAEWDAENEKKENDFSCFRQTRHIIGRFNNSSEPEGYHATPFWSRWNGQLLPVLNAVAAHYDMAEPDFPKVMLARLSAGGKIDPHSDIGVSNHLAHKIHVPLVTNGGVWFQVGAEKFQLDVGKAYELNNIQVHSVANSGAEDRIHLIFELFDRAAR